jgi:hypothetical protein
MRRHSAEYSSHKESYHEKSSPYGHVTVFFRLVSPDQSPRDSIKLHGNNNSNVNQSSATPSLQSTPLNTPFAQSPIQSPMHVHHPAPPPPGVDHFIYPPQSVHPGVFYTSAPSGPSPSPPFKTIPYPVHHPRPHSQSFCLPPSVSEEILISAMPERYDD